MSSQNGEIVYEKLGDVHSNELAWNSMWMMTVKEKLPKKLTTNA